MEVTDNNNRNPASLLNSLHENQPSSSPLIGSQANTINILNNPPTLNQLPFSQNILNPLNQQPSSLNILNQQTSPLSAPLFTSLSLKQQPVFSSTPGSFSRPPLTMNQSSHSPLSILHNPNATPLQHHMGNNQITSPIPNSSPIKSIANLSTMQPSLQILPNNSQSHQQYLNNQTNQQTVIQISNTQNQDRSIPTNPNHINNININNHNNNLLQNQKLSASNGSQQIQLQPQRQQPQKIIIPDDDEPEKPEEPHPTTLKTKYGSLLLENWALFDQLEKFKKQVTRLTKEKK